MYRSLTLASVTLFLDTLLANHPNMLDRYWTREYSILPTKASHDYGVPLLLLLLACALFLSLAHWLITAPTLPDFDLHLVEIDIKVRTWRTRCECYVDVYFLFFLTFSSKLLSWWWRLVTHFFSIFWWQFHNHVRNHLLFEIVFWTNLDRTVHSV